MYRKTKNEIKKKTLARNVCVRRRWRYVIDCVNRFGKKRRGQSQRRCPRVTGEMDAPVVRATGECGDTREDTAARPFCGQPQSHGINRVEGRHQPQPQPQPTTTVRRPRVKSKPATVVSRQQHARRHDDTLV